MSIKFNKSNKYFSESKRIIPAQTQTFSKGWTQYPLGKTPLYLFKAKNGHVWDVDNNIYVDWPMGIGPMILGYNFSEMNKYIFKNIKNGIAFSLPHKKEVDFSKQILKIFNFADMVRFGKNGSDVTTGAIRLARAHTNKDIILCSGYHGWHDWFIATTTRSKGIPDDIKKLTKKFNFNDIDQFDKLIKKYSNNIAGIIIEPPVTNDNSEYEKLAYIKKIAKKNKIVLIFDEIWTGFRVAQTGTIGIHKIRPDLACYGKAIGNGYPISILAGKRNIMSKLNEVFFSFTFGGDIIGLTAAEFVTEYIKTKPVLSKILNLGNEIKINSNNLIKKYELENYIKISGYPQRSFFNFYFNGKESLLIKSIFQQECISQGVLTSGWHAPCYTHTKADVKKTLNVYKNVFKKIKLAIDNKKLNKVLKGKVVQNVFRPN